MAVNITSVAPGGGGTGCPVPVSQTRTRWPAAASQMPGVFTVVSMPERTCPSGACQRAVAAPAAFSPLLYGPSRVRTATLGCSRAASACCWR